MKFTALAVAAALIAGPAAAATTGLSALFYNAPADTIANTAQAKAQAVGAPTATFTATKLQYGTPGDSFAIGTLSSFLGANATNLSGAGGDSFQESVLVFSGLISLNAGVNNFSVTSDDGFELKIDGTVVSFFDGLRGPNSAPSTGSFTAPTAGHYAFDLLYYEGNVSQARLEVALNGKIIDDTVTKPGVIPVPAALPLLASALGLFGLIARRRAA